MVVDGNKGNPRKQFTQRDPQPAMLSLSGQVFLRAAIAMEVLLPGTVGHTCHGTEPVRSVSLSSR